ncbi:MAG TPA: hypothetical protein VFR14_10140 [Candidatus Limnocylindrales bacterium]|nr:hypothetical protein [Candidatus Limnocylindrales bacterium]
MRTERIAFGGISIRNSLRLATRIVKERRALGRAVKRMPRPMPWDWASPRLLPLLCGPYLADDELVTDSLEPGCAVVFGVDLGRTFTLVDPEVAERWEVSTGQLRDRAVANLRARASRLGPEVVRRGVLSGRVMRHTGDRITWAASLAAGPGIADAAVRIGRSDLPGAGEGHPPELLAGGSGGGPRAHPHRLRAGRAVAAVPRPVRTHGRSAELAAGRRTA